MRIKAYTDPLPLRRNLKGRLVLRQTPHGLYALAWPRKRGRPRKPSQVWWTAMFGTAAQMAARPNGLDQAFAEAWAPGSTYAQRDLLTMAALGSLFEIIMPDGTIMEVMREMAGNPQATLDLITDVPGSILFRSTIGWIGIAPGAPGQLLQYVSQDALQWTTAGAPSAAAVNGLAGIPRGGVDTRVYPWKGIVVRPSFKLAVPFIYARLNGVAGGTYLAEIWRLSGTTLAEVVAQSTPWEPTATGVSVPVLKFPAPPALDLGPTYALMVGRTDAEDTWTIEPYEGSGDQWDWGPSNPESNACLIRKARPMEGDTVTLSGTSISLRWGWTPTP